MCSVIYEHPDSDMLFTHYSQMIFVYFHELNKVLPESKCIYLS